MGMRPIVQDGVLVLADISGFTEFVTVTELEHGPQIIAALLEAVMRHLSPPLEIQEVEGDAIFAVGAEGAVGPRTRLLDVLDNAFIAFKDRQREMEADDSCSCGACRRVANLDLKIVVHHGRFLRQSVGGRGQLAGVDVILVHRLLKNGLGRKRAYLLLTEAALRWLGVELVRANANMTTHIERYEHLGDVRCFIRDLGDPVGQPSSRAAAFT
jgi:uncharacterized protein DUF2652